MPSWSADGASLLTLTRYGLATDVRDYEVARTDISSGHTRSVARLPDGLIPFTVVEGASGVVLIGVGGQPLHVVAAAGGTPTPVGVLDAAAREVEQQSPVFLPDGRRFFYTSVREGNQLTARLRSLDSDEVQDLAGVDGRIVWANEQYVIFRRDASLFAQAIRFAPLALLGRPTLLTDNATVLSFLPRQPLAGATSALRPTGPHPDLAAVHLVRPERRAPRHDWAGDHPPPSISRVTARGSWPREARAPAPICGPSIRPRALSTA